MSVNDSGVLQKLSFFHIFFQRVFMEYLFFDNFPMSLDLLWDVDYVR